MEQAAEVQSQTSVPQSQTQSSQAQTEQPSFKVPEAYQDRGWAKTIDSEESLWKTFDETQKMIGRKTIPDADAPKEKWDEFYNQLGRPESPDKYELRDSFDGLPEGSDLSESKQMAAQLAHEIGLTPQQASQMWEKYMSFELDAYGKMQAQSQEQEKALDEEYETLANKLFGDKSEQAQSQAEQYLKNKLPPELDGAVDSIRDNPKAMMALIKVANDAQAEIAQIKKQYGAEDNLASGQQSGALSQEEVLAKIRDTKKAINDAPPFSKVRGEAEAELERLRGFLK